MAAALRYVDTGVIYRDDNLELLEDFPDECIDLVYLDPPFFSNRDYEVIWGDEAEIRSFKDRWKGGIDYYVDWMSKRLRQMHRVLRANGSLFLHCDQAASHYLKVALDEIFGRQHFRNEIIWRRTASNSAAKRFGPIHQTILYYGKSDATPFYPVHGPYTEGYVRDYFTHEDERGRYRPVLLTGSGTRKGESGSQWRHYNPTSSGRHWAVPKYLVERYQAMTGGDLTGCPLVERLDRLDEAGLIHWGTRKASGGVPNYKYYLSDASGVALQDIWGYQPGTAGMVYGRPDEGIDQDVKWLSAKDRERVGYPTQKPEGVLERIIRSSTKKGDVVLDPFCGCGTTVAVAHRLGREWIGIDISPSAVEVMKDRLEKNGATPKTEGLPETEDDLRELGHYEFQNWAVLKVHGEPSPTPNNDEGVDGLSFMYEEPIQVKQSDQVDRPQIDKMHAVLDRTDKEIGYVIAFSFSQGSYREAARFKRKTGKSIVLVTVTELLEATEALTRPPSPFRDDDPTPPTPDLMRLLKALTESAADRPLVRRRRKAPSVKTLFDSEQARTEALSE
jgi:DNA modification methylase